MGASSDKATADTKVMITVVMFVEIWNWRSLRTASLAHRPYMIALTIEAKLSSVRMISEASLAISVPAIPIENPTWATSRVGPSFVPSPTDNLTGGAEGFNRNLLVFWGGSGQDLGTVDDLSAFLWVGDTENRALHDGTSGSENAALGGDWLSGGGVVSGAHLECDACVVAGCDGFTNAKAKWILDSSDGCRVQVAREVLARDLVIGLEVGFGGGPAPEVLVVEPNCP